ncbi:MAG: isoprenyl transferase [Phycisphaerales bacterium]|nr:isoprenyl transferase [Phycisphaerales bacterium]
MNTSAEHEQHRADTLAPESKAALDRIRSRYPDSDPLGLLPGVDPIKIPKHIAMIMDGNGRWAQERGLPRIKGHHQGAKTVRTMLKACAAVGVEVLTLYSFSTENWSRPVEEIEGLMEMCVAYCEHEREALREHNVRVRVLGKREGMPGRVLEALDALVDATSSCSGITLCLAVNYGGRDEIVDAARKLAQRVKDGEFEADAINTDLFADHLTTRGLPDPDLLIRTGGDFRISNYLLWQISYAEIMVTDVQWPDFESDLLYDMIKRFAGRSRRFGNIES